MQTWEYKVAFIDYRGRISSEGHEMLITNERRTAFVRRYLDMLGRGGWDLVGIQPLGPQSAYYVFKRPGSGAAGEGRTSAEAEMGARTGPSAQPADVESL